MNSISIKEKEDIKSWAANLENNIYIHKVFTTFSSNVETYFEKFENKQNIEEYDFNSIRELESLLDSYVDDDILKNIKTSIMIAIMKSQNTIEENKNSQECENKDMFQIPEYVYVF